MRTGLVVFVAIILALPMFAQGVDQRRLITVEGEAERFVRPDMATISLGVINEGLDIVTIKRENDKRARAIQASLVKLGVDPKDIMTTDLSIQPVYNWNTGKQELLHYAVRNTVIITVRNLESIERILDAAIDKGMNLLQDVSFSLSTARAVRDEIRAEAARNARKKAEDLAGAVGAKIGRVVTLSESSGSMPPVPMYRTTMMAKADEGATVSAGQLQIRVLVSATFELE